MFSYSDKSQSRLLTCHLDIQLVFNQVIKVYDCSVLCGTRNEAEQNEAFKNGFSKLEFPDSNHNELPSNAIDVVPYPIDWGDINAFFQLNGVIKSICFDLNIELTWGGIWKMKDYPHYELRK